GAGADLAGGVHGLLSLAGPIHVDHVIPLTGTHPGDEGEAVHSRARARIVGSLPALETRVAGAGGDPLRGVAAEVLQGEEVGGAQVLGVAVLPLGYRGLRYTHVAAERFLGQLELLADVMDAVAGGLHGLRRLYHRAACLTSIVQYALLDRQAAQGNRAAASPAETAP